MNKEEIKAKILFGGMERIYRLGKKHWFALGDMGKGQYLSLTIVITNQSIIAKLYGLIKIRDIPLSDITAFEYIEAEKLPMYSISDGIRIIYNEKGKSIEEYIFGGKKSLREFLSVLQGFKKGK